VTRTGRVLNLLCIAAVIAASTATAPRRIRPTTRSRSADSRRALSLAECTNHPSRYLPEISHEKLRTVIDIPEVHDCQRLMSETRGASGLTKSYSILAGVFSYEAADPIDATEYNTRWVNVALVYNWDEGAYKPLGITPGANCVYLTALSGWQALLVHNSDPNCPHSPQTGVMTTPLEVKRSSPSQLERDYPRAVRWDWDSLGSHSNYIVAKCGAATCEIGPPGFVASPAQTGDTRHTIKGWYDEQYLATTNGVKPNVRTVPSERMVGRFFPSPELDGARRSAFICRGSERPCMTMSKLYDPHETEALRRKRYEQAYWFPVGTIQITNADDVYRRRYSLDAKGEAIVLVQNKRRSRTDVNDDTIQWRVWFMPKTGTDAGRIRRVDRVDHTSIVNGVAQHHVPGTARWHWITEDDTTWHACGDGCCSTDP
jgi:hypothetical protein